MKNRIARALLPVSAIVFFVQSSAVSQTDAAVQQVTGKDRTIIVRETGKDHSYNFEDDLQLREIGQVKLLFQNRVKGKLYLLMYVIESIGAGNGQCGAGQEEYLIWQVLDSKWVQNDYKVELIGSCAHSIENRSVGPDSYEITQGKLTSEYVDYPDNYVKRTRTLTYDSANPEHAWTIQQKAGDSN